MDMYVHCTYGPVRTLYVQALITSKCEPEPYAH